jgi:hypothetical protein
MTDILDIYIGHDPREITAYDVCRWSIVRRTSRPVHIRPLMMQPLRYDGFYWRKHERRADGVLWDTISGAPMSTEFAITRFLAFTNLKDNAGQWRLFMDCDFLALADVAELFDAADERYAVQVVKHRHEPPPGVKMDGQPQVQYARKNWSSLMLINAAHPANARLTLEMVNGLPGRDLHRFCWLRDDEIGDLPKAWNFLVGHTNRKVRPKLVHYTDGAPFMPGYEACDFADEWRRELDILSAYHAPIRGERAA